MLENFLAMTSGTWEPTQETPQKEVTAISRAIKLLGKSTLDLGGPIPVDIVKAAVDDIMKGKATSAQISAFLVALSIHGVSLEVNSCDRAQ